MLSTGRIPHRQIGTETSQGYREMSIAALLLPDLLGIDCSAASFWTPYTILVRALPFSTSEQAPEFWLSEEEVID